MNKDIEQALSNFRADAARYAKAERYYNGDHDLAFATEKFLNTFGALFREFALNLCPVVCDAVRDKLRVTGFSIENAGDHAAMPPGERRGSAFPASSPMNLGGYASDPGGTALETLLAAYGKAKPFRSSSGEAADAARLGARTIWMRNRMGTRAGEVHKEAVKAGDAYVILWPDADGRAVIYPNRAGSMTVVTDDDAPGRVLWAAKYWIAPDKHVRLNLFYPDRIEKYSVSPKSKVQSPTSDVESPTFGGLSALDFGPWKLDGDAVVPNPYGVVPVFHFANNADLGLSGRSELEAAIPVQDGLNKSVLDMLVAMEFSAYRQRWAAGIEVDIDSEGKPVAPFTAGVEHLWISENPNARFGDFDTAELEQFLKVKDSFRIDIASVTGTPLHYFLQTTGDFPSGESLKKAETRFLAKVRDRQESFGQVWADAMSFALRIEGRDHVSLITEWEDPAPMSERERLENLLLKKQLGLSTEESLIEAGYGAEDVKAMPASRSAD